MDELRVNEGEAGELALVDVGDDQLVRRGQDGLRACEELVEIFCSFATLDRQSVEKENHHLHFKRLQKEVQRFVGD